MKRHVSLALFVLLAVAPLAAQAPKGWLVRADRSTSASDPDGAGAIKFSTSGSGFHAVNPQAAVYWNPANTATGNYSLKGTFTLMRPSSHANYYGLVFGGSGLEGSSQTTSTASSRRMERGSSSAGTATSRRGTSRGRGTTP
jgi:hypothetical protein